ncbi:MAG TPA: response regulator [Opitutaceae bacterium]|nr:response regulator [Opitutaceae bacterium]
MAFNGKVLLIDDESHIRKFVGLLLKQLGSPTIVEAANGLEAIALYQQERPDLVLLDVNMPGIDGLATLRKLRELDPEVVAIMLTSLASRQMVEGAAELGACLYIRKDTPKDEMLKMLRETIETVFEPKD